jgi:hypothetical protein
MQERQPPQEETEESREGTAAHWLLEQTLLKLPVAADAIAPNGVPINDEMREAIADVVTDIVHTLGTCKSGDYFQVEQRVSAANTIHPDNWGTPDVFFVQHSGKTLHLWDFKYGHRYVDEYMNWQMIDYAACIIETENITDWQDWTFTFTIAQPRCYNGDGLGGTLREWFTDGRTLAPLFDQLRVAAADASAPGALCKTGDYCLDCLAAFDCPALQRAGGAVMQFARGQQSLGMDPASVGLELKMLDDAEGILKARKNALTVKAQALMNERQSVPYHQITWSQPRTVWAKDKQAEAANIVAMFGVPVYLGVALPTPKDCIKAGVDETVISPYTTKATAAQKVTRLSDHHAAKVFGRR